MERRRTVSSILFTALLALGLIAVQRLAPNGDVALAAGAAWVVFLLFAVAATDLAALLTRRRPRSVAWLPQWPLPAWLEPVRASLVAVAFLYGVLLGHFLWR